jgi:hypothetical protein
MIVTPTPSRAIAHNAGEIGTGCDQWNDGVIRIPLPTHSSHAARRLTRTTGINNPAGSAYRATATHGVGATAETGVIGATVACVAGRGATLPC